MHYTRAGPASPSKFPGVAVRAEDDWNRPLQILEALGNPRGCTPHRCLSQPCTCSPSCRPDMMCADQLSLSCRPVRMSAELGSSACEAVQSGQLVSDTCCKLGACALLVRRPLSGTSAPQPGKTWPMQLNLRALSRGGKRGVLCRQTKCDFGVREVQATRPVREQLVHQCAKRCCCQTQHLHTYVM